MTRNQHVGSPPVEGSERSPVVGARAQHANPRRFTLVGVAAQGGEATTAPAFPIDPATGLPSFADPEEDPGETFIGLGGAMGSDPRRAKPVQIVGNRDPAAPAAGSDRLTPLIPFVDRQWTEALALSASDESTFDQTMGPRRRNPATAATKAHEWPFEEMPIALEGDRSAMLPSSDDTFGAALDDTLSL